MLARLPLALLSLSSLISAPAFAGLNGAISFSQFDQQRHQAGLPVIMETASACLQKDLERHQAFFRQWGISPFFGDQSTFAKADAAGKRAYLARMGFNSSQVDYLMGEMQPTSCIGLTLKCLGQGFSAAGQEDLWEKVRGYTFFNDVTGDALLHGLQQLGWRIHYWNPDVSQNSFWDEQEKQIYPNNPKYIWGFHEQHWRAVQRSGKYLYNKVDELNALVNFGKESPAYLAPVPFFVGLAHGGYHVFPGSYGQIIEAHSTRQLNDRQTVETSSFNPLANGGGPRGLYRSGLIAIPPAQPAASRHKNRKPRDWTCRIFNNC